RRSSCAGPTTWAVALPFSVAEPHLYIDVDNTSLVLAFFIYLRNEFTCRLHMSRVRWNLITYRRGLQLALPGVPAVYVIASVERVHGLPVRLEPLYVGQTKNVRRRTTQHLDRDEPNPELNGAVARQRLELWWRSVPAEQLNDAEDELIETFAPR